jgi:hypothetical protein
MWRKLVRAHRYMVFHSFLWQKFLGSPVPEFGAIIQMAATLFVNLLLVTIVIHFLFEVWIPPMGFGPSGAFAFGFGLLGAEYWSLKAAGGFNKIKEEFESQPESSSRRGRRIIAIYGFVSILLCVIVPILIRYWTWPS